MIGFEKVVLAMAEESDAQRRANPPPPASTPELMLADMRWRDVHGAELCDDAELDLGAPLRFSVWIDDDLVGAGDTEAAAMLEARATVLAWHRIVAAEEIDRLGGALGGIR